MIHASNFLSFSENIIPWVVLLLVILFFDIESSETFHLEDVQSSQDRKVETRLDPTATFMPAGLSTLSHLQSFYDTDPCLSQQVPSFVTYSHKL